MTLPEYQDGPVISIPQFRRIHRAPGFVGLEHFNTYPRELGPCLCGHPISHHGAPAIGRPCERCEGTTPRERCQGFVPASEEVPMVRWYGVGYDPEQNHPSAI